MILKTINKSLTRIKIIKELNKRGYHTIDKKDSTSHLRSLLGIYENKENELKVNFTNWKFKSI